MGALAKSEPESGRTYTCKVARLLGQVDDEDKAALIRHLENPAKSHMALSHWLGSHDMRISAEVLRKHRIGGCQCGPGADGVLPTGVVR